MENDGKLDPLEGLSSPIGLGTLAIALALTEVVQQLAGKDNDILIKTLEGKLNSKIFENGGPEAQKNFKAPIEKAIKVARAVKAN